MSSARLAVLEGHLSLCKSGNVALLAHHLLEECVSVSHDTEVELHFGDDDDRQPLLIDETDEALWIHPERMFEHTIFMRGEDENITYVVKDWVSGACASDGVARDAQSGGGWCRSLAYAGCPGLGSHF